MLAGALDTSASRICGHVHDEECGYIKAVEGAPCSHQCEDGSYSCASVWDEDDDEGGKASPGEADYADDVCWHDDGCGYIEAVEGADCTHSCELCSPPVNVPPAGNLSGENPPTETLPGQNEGVTDTCICDSLCTENVINPDCPVCSAEGADLTKCIGTEQETVLTYDEVVALFEVLPNAGSITAETTDEEKTEIMARINAALDALDALSDEDFAKFNEEHSDLLAAVQALQTAIISDTPTLLADSITGDGYSFNPDGGLLTISSIEGTKAWRFNNSIEKTAVIKAVVEDSVTSIGDNAFADCANLVEINLPDGLTSIGSYAFNNCGSLSLRALPDSVSSIGKDAFRYCTSLALTELSGSLTSINNDTFIGCTSLKLRSLPDKVISIGNSAFDGCTNLVLTELPGGVTSIGNYAFRDCGSLALTKLPDGMTSIGNNVFYNCTSLALTELPGNVTSIGSSAFSGCTSLALTELPGSVTSIGGSAFSGCANLALKKLPGSVTSIGNYAFSGCTGLTLLDIPRGTAPTLGRDAFRNILDQLIIFVPYNASGYTSENNWPEDRVVYGAALNSLTISGGTLAPAFFPGTNPYTLTDAADLETVTVTPTAHDTETITVNGKSVASGSTSEAITLEDGKDNEIQIVVKNSEVDKRTYTITISRAATAVELWRGGSKVDPNGDFETLADAIQNAQEGDKLVITANIDLKTTGVTISGKALTLDLNGKTITYSGSSTAITLSDSMGLTITDGGSGGTVKANSGSAIWNNSTGTVTVEGGTVSASGSLGTAIDNNSTGAVAVSGGTVSASGADGTAIFNNSTGTVTVTDGTVSASGSLGIAIWNTSTGTVTAEGGTVSASDSSGIAIRNYSNGTVTVSGMAKVTSANTAVNEGTIYIYAVPSDTSKTVLEITGGTVENTAADGYAVYFVASGVTSANLSDYYSHTGGTVGRVYPEPLTPTMEKVSEYITCLYANGLDLKLEEGGTADKTKVSYRTLGSSGSYIPYVVPEATGSTENGYDLSNWLIYGGSQNRDVAGTSITMTGGKVNFINGGGHALTENANVTGNTSVIVQGGTLRANVYGGGNASGEGLAANVGGNTSVTVEGTASVWAVYGGGGSVAGTVANVTGTATVTVKAGTIGDDVYGGGIASGNSTTGNTNVRILGGTVTGRVYGGGNRSNVTNKSNVTVTGGTIKNSVYGGGLLSTVGSASVTIGGGVKIGSTDKGIVINGGTANVTNGVDNFTIDPALAGDTDSICVLLPAGYTTGTIATGAVQADVSRIKLVGEGAEGREAYLDGTDIKILNDEQKIALAKQAIETALANLTVTNATTAQEILDVANAATLYDVTVTWDSADGFRKTDATASAAGSMTGTLKLTLNSASGTAAVSKVIARLSADTDGGSGGGGSSSGGGGSSSSGAGGTVTPPAETKPGVPTESEIKVDGTVDANGSLTVTLPENTVDEAIKKAEDEARRNGNLNNGVTIVLNVQGGGSSAGSVTVNLPKTTQETIIGKKIVNTVIVVNNPDIKIGMDLSAVTSINAQAKADVNITATKLNGAGLTEAAKAAIGSRPVFDFKVNYGGGKQVTNFDGGSVSVAIPYTLGAGEKAGGVYAVYVDGSGNVQWLPGSVYDAGNKVLRFSTSHFSTYGVGYKAPADVTDIAGHWAKDDIQFVVNRGLLSGTTATTFSPNTAMTRGMLVTALGRLAGADVSGYKKSSFTDVKADAYYMGYVEWAANNGIMKGITAATFGPDNAVTREQMAVTMADYAKATGFSLPKAHAQNTFADAADISSWAADSVKAMQMAGVLAGKNANRFDPQGTAARAEAAAAIRRFTELKIDATTAQGWMQNDDGQWMYYENGQPVRNQTKNVGGQDYSFDAYGVTLDFPKKKTGSGTYTVQTGDSFWLIAKKHNVNMYTLAEINGKTIHSVIHPGDVLKIPQ